MKYLYLIFIIFIAESCDPNDDNKNSCFAFLNGTDNDITLELYSYNAGRSITEIGNYGISGVGLLTNFCKSSRRALGPVSVIRMDSIVVKFDNNRKLTFLSDFAQGSPDLLYNTDDYQRDGTSLNFSYTFTEEDYNNAVPF